ncbi:MAG: hypothetical protein WBW79_18420 [Desulfocapsaceae bacterium]
MASRTSAVEFFLQYQNRDVAIEVSSSEMIGRLDGNRREKPRTSPSA